MKDGFLRVGSATPVVKVGDIDYNVSQIKKVIDEACQNKLRMIVLPELCVTAYTCGDLFGQDLLIHEAEQAVKELSTYLQGKDLVVVVGFPLQYCGNLYNCAGVLFDGKILGVVPKYHLPNYSEFYEARKFSQGQRMVKMIPFADQIVPFGMNLLFSCENIKEFVLALEICEDLWVPNPPSIDHALHGATVIANTSASNEVTGKVQYRKNLVMGQSGRLVCAYLFSSAGEGESTTDLVFSGHNMIAENGTMICESNRFSTGLIFTEIDVKKIIYERRKMSTFECHVDDDYYTVSFAYSTEAVQTQTELSRTFSKFPFVPGEKANRDERCNEIIMIQAMGLKKRLEHTGVKSVVLGISGGLDSTLALLVTVEAFKMLNLDLKGIVAVTMPCFGTTDRTYNNAVKLSQLLGTTLLEVPIKDAVIQHLKDLKHDIDNHDVTYENAQARERTQILMNLSNKYNGFVVGTGDLSELALGWATYNGDHMSMYGVNASIPKTLMRYLVSYVADTRETKEAREVLLDILDTPVSPELLPPKDGEISQKTEDLVGPYELHDFFIYYMMRCGFEPSKIYRIACKTFKEDYNKATIYKWLRTFYWRFFSQQFKRSCLPDGPKVGSVALSPRGDWRMPSDACVALWMKDLESIKPE